MSSLSTALGNAGIVAVLILWIAPVYDVFLGQHSVLRTRRTTNLATGFGFIASLFNCVLWIMYMSTRQQELFEAFIVNVLGIVVNSALVACYWYYSQDKQRLDTNVQMGFLSALTGCTGLTWAYLGDNAFVAYVAMVLNLLMYFGPLVAASEIIKSRSISGMPLGPVLMTIVASSLWTAYAAVLWNVPILIPNVGGILFGLAQLYVWLYVYLQHHQQPAASDYV